MLIAMAGLPASGKSVIARKLAQRLQGIVLDKDEARASLFGTYVDYTREQDDLCVAILYDVARYHRSQRPGTPIILDGRTYSRRYQVAALKQAAERMAVPLTIVECVCAPESAKQRLEQDFGVHLARDRDYSLYLRSCAGAEPIEEPKLILDTDRHDPEECVAQVLAFLEDGP